MSAVDKSKAAWGADLPEWVLALAEECDRTSQNKTATRIGRSPSLVSFVLAKKYTGDLRAVEDLVRALLMSDSVVCPCLGEIKRQECRTWRAAARDFRNVNTLYVQMFRACNRCPIFKEEESKS
ncbi:hypothetical protein CDO87_14250 [Sagittula sp. P11]|uniref:hypothetical protein n=1 Tax=Sagittula sp. P11 TaxID=2009329 RepID=UPI000C2D0727|nr:hypothetical protein [Sagittula sp. P11]AUC54266.1 hypothetical protein CDO87_14250 [Sagittula sp. P11]